MDCLVASTSNLVVSETETQSPNIDGENTDLILKSSDGEVKAHKSVVRCCPYFAAIIDGNWLESQSSIITLDVFSYKAVRFVVEHLYKPKETIPNSQNLAELLALVDMLGIESLTELVCCTMVVKVCHNFHKPCKDCVEGVISCFQLTLTHHLVDMHNRCLEWLTKHFCKTWNSKSFANLPDQQQQSILESVKCSMNVENIIDVSLNCQQLQEMLPSVKWVEPVNALVKLLSAACLIFIQNHFDEILLSAKFKSLRQEDTWNLGRVETIILEAVANLPVEQACLSYLTLENTIHASTNLDEDQCPDSTYVDFITKLHKSVEGRLIQRVGMATKCSAWNVLPPAKQKQIMQMGFFDPIDSKPHLKNSSTKPIVRTNLRRNQSLNVSVPIDSSARVMKTEPFRQANVMGRCSLRSTGPRVRPTAPHQAPINRSRATVITRSQSVRNSTSGTVTSTTRATLNSSRPNSNSTGLSNQNAG